MTRKRRDEAVIPGRSHPAGKLYARSLRTRVSSSHSLLGEVPPPGLGGQVASVPDFPSDVSKGRRTSFRLSVKRSAAHPLIGRIKTVQLEIPLSIRMETEHYQQKERRPDYGLRLKR